MFRLQIRTIRNNINEVINEKKKNSDALYFISDWDLFSALK